MSAPNPSHSGFTLTGLCVLIGGCCVAGPLAAFALNSAFGWTADAAQIRTALALPAVAWLLASGVGLGIIIFKSRGRVGDLGFAVIAASIIRMFMALPAALMLFFTTTTNTTTYWANFLITGLTILIVETAWAYRTLTASHQSRTSAGVR